MAAASGLSTRPATMMLHCIVGASCKEAPAATVLFAVRDHCSAAIDEAFAASGEAWHRKRPLRVEYAALTQTR
jgi:hypothetical protein